MQLDFLSAEKVSSPPVTQVLMSVTRTTCGNMMHKVIHGYKEKISEALQEEVPSHSLSAIRHMSG